MEATVLTAAIVLVAAAIIGGGLKAFNIEVPLLDSGVRQVALLGFGGFLFFLALVILPEDSGPSPTTPATTTADTTQPETRDTTATTESPTTIDEDSRTSTPEIDEATGTGQVAHCANLTVVVGPVALEENQLWVPIRVENAEGSVPVDIPPDNRVTLTDDEGVQYALATFAQLRNGQWPLGQTIATGSTFNGRIIYERSGSGRTGRLVIAEIRNANDPFQTCSVTIEGFGLP